MGVIDGTLLAAAVWPFFYSLSFFPDILVNGPSEVGHNVVFTITLVLSACSVSVLPTVDSGKFALLF